LPDRHFPSGPRNNAPSLDNPAVGYQLQIRRRQERVERRAGDEFHGQELDSVGLLDRKDRDDVGVIERGDGLGFALEAHRAFQEKGPRMRVIVASPAVADDVTILGGLSANRKLEATNAGQPICSRRFPRIGSNFQFGKLHSRLFREDDHVARYAPDVRAQSDPYSYHRLWRVDRAGGGQQPVDGYTRAL